MPRCFSISIQSEVAWRAALRALTLPAIWMAPENSSSFSVSVVLPASGWEMMANVRRRLTCLAISVISDITADYRRRGRPGLAAFNQAGEKARLAHAVNHHFFIEHRRRPHPQAALAVERAVQRHRLQGFAVAHRADDFIGMPL